MATPVASLSAQFQIACAGSATIVDQLQGNISVRPGAGRGASVNLANGGNASLGSVNATQWKQHVINIPAASNVAVNLAGNDQNVTLANGTFGHLQGYMLEMPPVNTVITSGLTITSQGNAVDVTPGAANASLIHLTNANSGHHLIPGRVTGSIDSTGGGIVVNNSLSQLTFTNQDPSNQASVILSLIGLDV
jgi:hypothetical protein